MNLHREDTLCGKIHQYFQLLQ